MAQHPETNPHFVRQQPQPRREDDGHDRPWPNPNLNPPRRHDNDPLPRSRGPQVQWMPDPQQQEVPLMVPHSPEDRHTRWTPRTRRPGEGGAGPAQPKTKARRGGPTPPVLVPEHQNNPHFRTTDEQPQAKREKERLPRPQDGDEQLPPPLSRQGRHFLPLEPGLPHGDQPPRQGRHFHPLEPGQPQGEQTPRQGRHFQPLEPGQPQGEQTPRQGRHFQPLEPGQPQGEQTPRQGRHFQPLDPSQPHGDQTPRQGRHFQPLEPAPPKREKRPSRTQDSQTPRQGRQSRHFQPLEQQPRHHRATPEHGLWAPTSRKTKPVTWFAAVFCVIFWIIIILGGIIVLIVYLVFRPRSPKFEIPAATLNAAYLDMGYLLNADLTLLANFTNPNKKVNVDFSYMIIDLYYGTTLIATQHIDPFSAEKVSSKFQTVHMVSSQVRLPIKESQRLQKQMAGNGAIFEVKGVFRTRSRLGSVLRYSYWLYAHCKIVLTAPPTGVLRASYCRTKR